MTRWAIDTEFGWKDGVQTDPAFSPVLCCMVNLDTGRARSFWGRDPGLAAFVRRHRNDLFIAHNATAEMSYLLRLGIEPPARWFDTMIGFRFYTNREVPPKARLTAALDWFGLTHACGEEKSVLQARLGRLGIDPDDPAELRAVEDYCREDCVKTGQLYGRLAPRVPATFMQFASDYCVQLARMERNGIPLDMATYERLFDRREEVINAVVARANDTNPVFVNGRLSRQAFFTWCVRNGVGWPLTRSPHTGQKILSLDQKIFERMKTRHPFIQLVHECNKTVLRLNKRSLAVDTGSNRHYAGNIPYAQSSGRTSLKGNLFQCPKWMRHLAVPPSSDHALIAVDYDAEEVAIAAYLSGDVNMMEGYKGDPHMRFAILAGAAPEGATKDTHPEVRKKYKQVNLATNYGQSAFGLAQQTGVHLAEAEALLGQHQKAYPAYYAWQNRYVSNAVARGRCHTIAGWPRLVGRLDNGRSVTNFPVQGAGADLMRLSVIYLSRAGLKLLAAIHDGFLIECRRKEVREVRDAIDAALKHAVTQLLPGCPMTWTVEVFADRYRDADGKALWDMIYDMLHPGHVNNCESEGVLRG
jgi:hypothetical protein